MRSLKNTKYRIWLGIAMSIVDLHTASAQTTLKIHPLFNGNELMAKTWYITSNNDSLQISTLRFYLTDIRLTAKNGVETDFPDGNFLIDLSQPESLDISLSDKQIKNITGLSFNVGVKEEMNTSGALSGALDPSNGMYWSWQSGYINFKIEGRSPSCDTRNNKFQLHIGGYEAPLSTTRRVEFTLKKNSSITINLNIEKLFDRIDLKTHNQIMIPGKEASEIADILPTLFTIN